MSRADVIPRDSHLDARGKICILIDMIVPKLEHAGEVQEGNMKLVKTSGTVMMAEPKKILGYSKAERKSIAELGMYPLEQTET